MAQLVSSLLCYNIVCSSQVIGPRVGVWACNTGTREAETENSRSSERPCLRNKVENYWSRHLTPTSILYTTEHRNIYRHVYHTYIHTVLLSLYVSVLFGSYDIELSFKIWKVFHLRNVSNPLLSIFMYFCLYGYVCGCPCTTLIMYKSENNLQMSVFSHHVGSRDQTQTLRFGDKDIYPLDHLTGNMFTMTFFCI